MKVASMFAGIGGICLGFKQAGFNIVWANEVDSDACKTYRKNLGDHYLIEDDIRNIDPKTLPDFDVLTAGFPCQPFSIAGKQKGFKDKRGNLFFEIAKIIDVKRPKIVFLENVRNLEDHDNGKTFLVIYNTLAQFGYGVRYKVLNAKDYGVPQNRERIFIIGFLDDWQCNNFKYPESIKSSESIFDIIRTSDKKHPFYYYDDKSPYFQMLSKSIIDKSKIYKLTDYGVRKSKTSICPTLTANMGTFPDRVPIIKDDFGIRKLMPSECLLLQGFPDNFQFPKNISIESAYKQVGNSVCVPLIKFLAEQLKVVMEIK